MDLSAVQALIDAVGPGYVVKTSDTPSRTSWEGLCELVEVALRRGVDLRRVGRQTARSSRYKYYSRLRLAQVLTLEDALRFILQPRDPIDFSCVNHAITAQPGRVDLVAYVVEPYAPCPGLFELFHGAACALLEALEPEGQVRLRTHGRQAHWVFLYPLRYGARQRLRTLVSRQLHRAYSAYSRRTAYPTLLRWREMYEEQLVARANAEEELCAREEDFERRMQHVDDVIGELDSSGTLVYVGPRFKHMVGLSTDAAIDFLRHVVHREDMPRVERDLRAALAGRVACRVDDFRTLDPDLSQRWVELLIEPFVAAGGDRRTIVIARDVTEGRRFREERDAFDQQLEQTQRLESLGVLAGGIAHDFNNLLTPITGFAELVSAQLADRPDLRSQVDMIQVAASKASDLVRQLSAYAGKQPAEFVTVDLAHDTRELLDLLKTSVSPKVELRVELQEKACVLGDASQLRQVVMNLVINAAEAIGDRPGRIELSVLRRGDHVFLRVEDDGCGMDEVARRRAFEPFYTTKFAGRGLGLSAVLGIVEAHNGQLSIESTVGEGTVIELKLVAKDATARLSAALAQEGFRGEGRVLLVDDEPLVRETGRQLLESLGYAVEVACEGEEALARFEEGFDLLVVDLMMPKVNGREVLAQVRQRDPRMPVLLVSGYAAQLAATQLHDPCTRTLGKPYRLDDLAPILQEFGLAARPGSS